MNLKHKNKKKKQKKNKNKRVSKLAEETQVYNSFLVHLDSM